MKILLMAALLAATASQAFAQSSAHTNWGLKTGEGGDAPIARQGALADLAAKVQDGAGLSGDINQTTIYQHTCAVCVTVENNGNGNNNDIKVDQDGNVSGVQRVKTVKK